MCQNHSFILASMGFDDGIYYRNLSFILNFLSENENINLPCSPGGPLYDCDGFMAATYTGEEVSIDKQVACEECPRWLKMTEVACEKTEVAVC